VTSEQREKARQMMIERNIGKTPLYKQEIHGKQGR
jgi:hypothetical protein